MDPKQLGIYLKKNKTFYILETGEIVINTHIERIKRILIQKNLIQSTDESYTYANQFEVIKLQEANEKDYKVEILYLNNHIRKSYENKQQNTTSKW